jgi:N utilization substance protein A
MKGMRVQSIIRELRGEKIDIIEYSDEITTFAEKALQPAKVSRVSITDLTDKQLEVIVDDTQLVAGHRQEGPERAPGGQAAGLEDRHQERRGEAPGGRAADAGSSPADPRRPSSRLPSWATASFRSWSPPASPPSRPWPT